MRLNHSVASEPYAVVQLTQSHDVSQPEVGSSLRAVFWCAALLWLPSVSGQSAGLAPTRDTRRGSTVALGASIHEIGAEVRQSQAWDIRGEEVEVQPGDTASEIAVVRLPAEVALDQMLVALLRRNPEVFVGGNVNRLPAGAILKIPDASTAAAIPLAEARRIIAEQNREYEAFRVALASKFECRWRVAAIGWKSWCPLLSLKPLSHGARAMHRVPSSHQSSPLTGPPMCWPGTPLVSKPLVELAIPARLRR